MGFDYIELIPRRIQDDTALNNDQKQMMSKLIEGTLVNYIGFDTIYKKSNDRTKRRLLKSRLSDLKQIARKLVLDPKAGGLSITEQRRRQKGLFYSLPKDLQMELAEEYAIQNNGDRLMDIEDFGGALAILENMNSKKRKAFLDEPRYQEILKGFKGFD